MTYYKEKEKTYAVENFNNQFFNLKYKRFIDMDFSNDDFVLNAKQVIEYFSNYDENDGEYNPIGISETCHVGGESNKYFVYGRKSYSQFIIEEIKNS